MREYVIKISQTSSNFVFPELLLFCFHCSRKNCAAPILVPNIFPRSLATKAKMLSAARVLSRSGSSKSSVLISRNSRPSHPPSIPTISWRSPFSTLDSPNAATEVPDFDDTFRAYGKKSTAELLRSYVVFQLCSFPIIVRNANQVSRWRHRPLQQQQQQESMPLKQYTWTPLPNAPSNTQRPTTPPLRSLPLSCTTCLPPFSPPPSSTAL